MFLWSLCGHRLSMKLASAQEAREGSAGAEWLLLLCASGPWSRESGHSERPLGLNPGVQVSGASLIHTDSLRGQERRRWGEGCTWSKMSKLVQTPLRR